MVFGNLFYPGNVLLLFTVYFITHGPLILHESVSETEYPPFIHIVAQSEIYGRYVIYPDDAHKLFKLRIIVTQQVIKVSNQVGIEYYCLVILKYRVIKNPRLNEILEKMTSVGQLGIIARSGISDLTNGIVFAYIREQGGYAEFR